MWTLITNCSKQLTIHSRVRESSDNYVAIYEIKIIEFDKFQLKLLERNNVPLAEDVQVQLTCLQIIQYGFEVEEKPNDK